MMEMWKWVLGYMRIYCAKIVWIFVFTLFGVLVFEKLRQKGYTKFCKKNKKGFLFESALSFSCSCFLTITLLGRGQGNYSFSIIPLESYVIAFSENNIELLLQIIMNVLICIPIGFLLPCCFEKFEKNRYLLLTVFICVGGVELVQGLFCIGYFELDDILNNTLGTSIGSISYKIVKRLTEKTIKI